jgi:hypothetical protein
MLSPNRRANRESVMKRLALLSTLSAVALALAACSPAAETPAPAAVTPTSETAVAPLEATPSPIGDTLTATGWGPLRIGMTKAEVIAAVGDTRSPDAAGIPGSDCLEFKPLQAPADFWVMIEGDKLTRITVGELSAVKDAKGLGLGDTAAKVKETYGASAVASPHKYQDAPAEYITAWEGGPRAGPYVQDEAARGIVYEIDGTGKVGAIHAGGPSIQYVEGCA